MENEEIILYDSNIDVILQTDDENDREEVLKLYCNKKQDLGLQ